MPATATVTKRTVHKPARADIAKQLDHLRTDLRRHFADVGHDAATQRAAVEKGLRDLTKDIERAFTAATATVRDPAVRKDILRIVETLRHEIAAAFDATAVTRAVHGAKPGTKGAHKTAARPAPARKATHR